MKTMKGFAILLVMVAGMLFVTGCGPAPGGGSLSASIEADHNTTSLMPDSNVTLKVTVSGGEAKSFSWSDNNTTIEGETEATLVYHITGDNLGDHNITVKVTTTDKSVATASVMLQTITTNQANIIKTEKEMGDVGGMIAGINLGNVKTIVRQEGESDPTVGGFKQTIYDPNSKKVFLGNHQCIYNQFNEIAKSSNIPGNFDRFNYQYKMEDGRILFTHYLMYLCSPGGVYSLKAKPYGEDKVKTFDQMAKFSIHHEEGNEFGTIDVGYTDKWAESNTNTNEKFIGAVVYSMGLKKNITYGGQNVSVNKKFVKYNGLDCIESTIITDIAEGLIKEGQGVEIWSRACKNAPILIKAKDT